MEQLADDADSIGEVSNASWANPDVLGKLHEVCSSKSYLLNQVRMGVCKNWRVWTHRRENCWKQDSLEE